MKRIKSVKKFFIYELSEKEEKEHGFKYAPVLKETVECYGSVEPSDADLECGTLESAIAHANSFDNVR